MASIEHFLKLSYEYSEILRMVFMEKQDINLVNVALIQQAKIVYDKSLVQREVNKHL